MSKLFIKIDTFFVKSHYKFKKRFCKIKKLNHKKIFFNFNFRFSKLAEVLAQQY